RVEGISVIRGEKAINWGLSGSILQASGIKWDLRKVNHYDEMTESIKIIEQALEGIPGGPYENLEIRCFNRERDKGGRGTERTGRIP
ncbi:hypothetical protein Golob_013206, partial [Gossypium lobatum]|nr:hypothetical protein [Gossypium lobatum]